MASTRTGKKRTKSKVNRGPKGRARRAKPPRRKARPVQIGFAAAAPPSRDVVKPQVIGVLSRVSGRPPAAIQETSKLEDDLGMTEPVRKNLSPPLSAIVRAYKPGEASRSACGKLKTVAAAIDLVYGAVQ